VIWLRWIAAIVKKDWAENARTFLLFFAGMFLSLFIPRDDLKEGAMVGLLFGASVSYAYFIYMMEKTRRTLPLLLGLPVRPLALILGKFASLFSMCLVTVNLPGMFLLDAHVLYLLNAEMLFLATICMAAGVFSEFPMAPFMPAMIIGSIAQINAVWTGASAHLYEIATVALGLVPVIAAVSVFEFHKQVSL
jgi:ABC-type transport system involved in multi-copper enzyme maturation permease subunit